MQETKFVDYYELMQISPNAEPGTIEAVYRLLITRYLPDNPETPTNDRFVLLNDAHRILADAALRSAYDLTYRAKLELTHELSNVNGLAAGIDGERQRRMELLLLLYARRRGNGDQPGMSLLEFESQMSIQRQQLMFTIWYLQSKGLIQRGEESNYAITVDGVDHVEQVVSGNTVAPSH